MAILRDIFSALYKLESILIGSVNFSVKAIAESVPYYVLGIHTTEQTQP